MFAFQNWVTIAQSYWINTDEIMFVIHIFHIFIGFVAIQSDNYDIFIYYEHHMQQKLTDHSINSMSLGKSQQISK